MTTIEHFTLDSVEADRFAMDLDPPGVSNLRISSFVGNGLLTESDSQEETLVENQYDFKSNGLLDVGTQRLVPEVDYGFESTGLLDIADDELQAFRSKHAPINESTFSGQNVPPIGGMDSEFGSTGLLDDDGVAEHCRSDEPTVCTLRSFLRNEPREMLSESQEGMPSLRQMLYSNGPVRTEASRRELRTDISSLSSNVSVTGTAFDGKTITFRRLVRNKARTTTERSHFGNLLDNPVHKLKDQLSEITAARLAQPEPEASSSRTLKTVERELWVDRYRPARFIDLLGDERVHRDTLAWLKEWDHCVFGKRKALNRSKKSFNDHDGNSEDKYEDAYHRPREKILLLSGPAGYGKTTLAHVVARQAGYEVMEINASDSRSGQVIDDRIRPTLESGSAVGSKKPVCVIIDEIDGATGAGDNSSTFIHKLIGLTFDKGRKKGRGDKKKEIERPLLRPIICICNDLYASSLTKLRQHARITRFSRPADVHLTKRLRTICDLEGLRTESRALTTLVGIAKGDMRGCLNTLQFIKARQQEVTESVIRAATVGMKEADTSFASVLSGLFAPLARKRVKELGMCELEESRYVSRLSADIDGSGSVDRIAIGCFEHYANLRHYDCSLARHEKAANWLVAFDSLSGAMRSEREYNLIPYLSYLLVPFYPLFHERGGGKVERPKADWEALMKMRTNEEIYKSLSKCVQSAAGQRCVGLRHFLSNEVMQLELAPYVNRIISPPMRPVNSQVTKPQERALLARLVDIMVTLELSFIQDKAEDGQLTYRLDPVITTSPIDAFITYDGKRASDVAIQRYATRRVIAGEIDSELIVRHAEIIERGKSRTLDMFKRVQKNGDDEPEDELEKPANRVSLGKRKPEDLDIADKPPVDFFGRPIAAPTMRAPKKSRNAGPSERTAPMERKFKVSYRYNEGNSSAVRKPVKVSSFF